MPYVAAEITLTNIITNILNKYAKSKTLPACQVQRAKIILLASAGKNNREISENVLLGQDSVSKWRTRWIQNAEFFANVEQNELQHLEDHIQMFLKDIPRPGCPCDIKEEQIIKILEIACRNPSDFGYEASHWSLNQLVTVVIKQGIVESISPASIRRFLKDGKYPAASRPLLASFYGKSGRS